MVGASPRERSPGRVVLENLVRRFRGPVYPVNPRYSSVLGLECYKSLKEVPDPLDLVVVAVPAHVAVEVVEEAGERGVSAAIVLCAGFAEAGREDLQRRLAEAAKKYGVRVVGPNCLGVFDPESGVDTFFIPEERLPRPPPGPVAIVSQSGAIASTWMEYLALEGLGVSKVVSLGNRVDVDEVEVLEYLAEDSRTKAVLLYVESLAPGRGRAFIEACRRASLRGKLVAVLKGGRTAAGLRAAESHTAALATSYEVYRAAFKSAGVVEVEDLEEAVDIVKAFLTLGRVKGRRVAVVTNAGGGGVIAADYVTEAGLELPALPPEVRRKLAERLRPYASTANPVDVTAEAGDEEYAEVLRILAESGCVDAILLLAPPHPPALRGDVAKYAAQVMRETGVPIVAVSMGGRLAEELRRKFEEHGVPAYPSPRRAARALSALAAVTEARQRL